MSGNSFLSTLAVTGGFNTRNMQTTANGFKPNGAPLIQQANDYNAPKDGEDLSKDQPGETYQVELFSPPYLYIPGKRPAITAIGGHPVGSEPVKVGYGSRVNLAVANDGGAGMATLIRVGAVTHAMDVTQKLHDVGLSGAGGNYSVTMPSSRNVAPPGIYMLFYLNKAGKPSIGQMVQLQ
jgi:hypothetical protein